MLVDVIKHASDVGKPEKVEVDSCFYIGERLKITYDGSTEISGMTGNTKRWNTGTADVKVVDIVCNMVINPAEVWVILEPDDPLFLELIGERRIEVPEKLLLKHIIREAG